LAEYASTKRSLAVLTQSLSQAPTAVVRSINAKRRAAGLPEVPTLGNPRAMLRPAPVTKMRRSRRLCGPATAAQWAGLKLDAAIACGRLRMNSRR
jgi:hypothetical protein